MRESRIRFIRQQGFPTDAPDEQLYAALMLQPKIVGVIVVLGMVSQSPSLFFVLSAALCWSALVPARNPFDAMYNYAVARPRGLRLLGAAPAPRRFAAAMAGTWALVIALALLAGARITAWVLEGLFAVANAQVVFGDTCAGANVYHLLHGRVFGRHHATIN